MKKLIIVLVVLAVVGVGAYYLLSNNGSGGLPTYTPTATNTLGTNTPMPTTESPVPTTTATPKVSKTPAPTSVSVSIANFAFNLSTLTVKKGTKITWTNNDGVAHTVTSDSGNLLNSPTLSPGQSFSFTFASAGTVNYHCAIHPMMKGVVIVTN